MLCLQCGKDMEDVSDGDSFLDIKRRIFAKTLNYYSSFGRVHCSETTEETTLTFYQQISFAVLVVVSYAYLLSGLSPHVRYAYFGQEFLSSKLANHSFTHENCGA